MASGARIASLLTSTTHCRPVLEARGGGRRCCRRRSPGCGRSRRRRPRDALADRLDRAVGRPVVDDDDRACRRRAAPAGSQARERVLAPVPGEDDEPPRGRHREADASVWRRGKPCDRRSGCARSWPTACSAHPTPGSAISSSPTSSGRRADLIDVGGLPGQLASFLPDTRVLAVNVEEPADSSCRPTRCRSPTGPSRRRQASTSSSTSLRRTARGSCARCSASRRRRSVLCCPLGSPEHRAAEEEIQAWYSTVAGDGHEWLDRPPFQGPADARGAAIDLRRARQRRAVPLPRRLPRRQRAVPRLVLARHRHRPADVAGYARFRLSYRPRTELTASPAHSATACSSSPTPPSVGRLVEHPQRLRRCRVPGEASSAPRPASRRARSSASPESSRRSAAAIDSGIVRIEQLGVVAGDLAQDGQVRARDEDPARHRLEHRKPEPLVERRGHEDVGLGVQRLEVVGRHGAEQRGRRRRARARPRARAASRRRSRSRRRRAAGAPAEEAGEPAWQDREVLVRHVGRDRERDRRPLA